MERPQDECEGGGPGDVGCFTLVKTPAGVLHTVQARAGLQLGRRILFGWERWGGLTRPGLQSPALGVALPGLTYALTYVRREWPRSHRV